MNRNLVPWDQLPEYVRNILTPKQASPHKDWFQPDFKGLESIVPRALNCSQLMQSQWQSKDACAAAT